jgi:hypothetical protein
MLVDITTFVFSETQPCDVPHSLNANLYLCVMAYGSSNYGSDTRMDFKASDHIFTCPESPAAG